MPNEAPLRFFQEPKLKKPRLVVAWGCIGQVGIDAVKYLRDKLGAVEFAEIEPEDFFPLPTLVINNSLAEKPEFEQSKFYSWAGGEGDDLIICAADSEPPQARCRYANLILEVARRFEVKEIYTACAFPALIRHNVEPGVFGVVNDAKLTKYLEQHQVMLLNWQRLTSMNALLLGLAKERGIGGIYLLSQVPQYTAEVANPISSRAILRVLTRMLGINIDLTEIDELVSEAEEETDRWLKAASEVLLKDFTVDYQDLFSEEDH